MFSVLYPPTEASAAIRAEVEAEIAAACAEDPWLRDHPPRITWPLDWPAVEVSPDSPLVGAVRGALDDLARVTGRPDEVRIVGMQGVTDASWFATRGIPAIVCGPGAAVDAHSAQQVAGRVIRQGTVPARAEVSHAEHIDQVLGKFISSGREGFGARQPGRVVAEKFRIAVFEHVGA